MYPAKEPLFGKKFPHLRPPGRLPSHLNRCRQNWRGLLRLTPRLLQLRRHFRLDLKTTEALTRAATHAGVTETVTIQSGLESAERENRRLEEQVRKAQQAQMNAPSQNVYNLQRRVAGVLPVRIDVPKAGKSYRFVRPLVLDEETNVTFQYRTK